MFTLTLPNGSIYEVSLITHIIDKYSDMLRLFLPNKYSKEDILNNFSHLDKNTELTFKKDDQILFKYSHYSGITIDKNPPDLNKYPLTPENPPTPEEYYYILTFLSA